ncbi:unnamed protein product [Orchesella dallaii]|uniref:N-acetyltransferase domain-containing protein n=1 Tax=Orchesella dallaii TaxID=48710 RepID=A0ABP1R4W2_9HEXA
MGPRFQIIPYTKESLQLLEEHVLVKRLPESLHILTLCRIASQDRFSKKISVQFYKYTDPTNEECLRKSEADPFIVCIQRPNIHTQKGIIMLPPQNPTPMHIQTFDNFIGWDRDQAFQCIQPSFWEPLQKLCQLHKNLNNDNSLGIPGIMLAMDNEQARQLNVPSTSTSEDEEIVYRSLNQDDVQTVVSSWKWAAPHSEAQIRETIQTLPSFGLFVKTADADGENGGETVEHMATCVMVSPLGAFNILHTFDNYRRRGFGGMLMKRGAKEVATQLDIPCLAEVEVWNDASKTLLEKVGYREIFQTRWYFYEPPCK